MFETLKKHKLGFLSAPIIPLLYITFMLRWEPISASFVLFYTIITSYFFALFVGLPLVHFLRRIHWLNLITLTVVGAVFGALSFAVFIHGFAWMLGNETHSVSRYELSFGMLIGGLAAIVFSVIERLPTFR